MVDKITDILAQNYADLNFVSKAAGTMQLMKKQQGKGKPDLVFPVAKTIYTGGVIEECDEAVGYYELLPNQNESCILYFEDRGAKAKASNKRFTTYEGKLRLVCWFNLKKIDPTLDPNVIKEQIRINLLSEIPQTGQLLATKIAVDTLAPNRPHPFSRFSLNEAQKQFTLYPYDYITINVKYVCHCNDHCALAVIANPAVC